MPNFQVVSLTDAMQRGPSSKRQRQQQEYLNYIKRVGPAEAGKLVPSDGESAMAVRRRLTAAVKASGKDMKVARSGDEVYFWHEAPRKRRGRPPKSQG